ncbi:MAG: D-alanyl-D-alanine carboxypeptidase/D-alanyl-D-alanine-endopeptidase [Planctomycetota bacterium]|nr:D-alanyl-D-alanine carboxypeptidase/D-alanyl-D-alanine-endopeptidase [Planctomycetota bacterium]
MAAGRKNSSLSPGLRLALVLALNAAAVFVLWRVWPRDSDAQAADRGAANQDEVPEWQRALRSAANGAAQLVDDGPQVDAPAGLSREQLSQLERGLRATIEKHVEEARKLTGGKVHQGNTAVALHVREVGAGSASDIALGSERLMRPASNLKLVTTAAALALLGPDWQFRTRFDATGPIEAGVLRGDLVVRAGGDPLYDPTSNGDVEHLLAPVISELAGLGITVIAGDIVLDEGEFQRPAPAPQWPEAGQHWAEYCALAGGFSANRGCLTAIVSPSGVGTPARVEVFPREHGLPLNVGVRTEAKGGVDVQCGARPTGVIVRGSIARGSAPFVASFSHPDPVELFGYAFSGALARRGIVVQGRFRRERNVRAASTLAELRTPLENVLGPINADSTNAVADQLFLATAQAVIGQGTRAAGAQATRLALERLGVPREGFEQVDGSGLSRANRITAQQVVALIEKVLTQDRRSARLYLDSLAVAGERGTLDDRMGKTVARGRVRAKTGFIDGTSALSGVAEALDGRRFVFSILVNYPDSGGLNKSVWKPMQDELCVRLVEVGKSK